MRKSEDEHTKKKVLFIHSAGAQGINQGSSNLVEFLREQLGEGYMLLNPEMPDPEKPDCTQWRIQIEKELSGLNEDVILIGHSLGGTVLIKCLSEGENYPSISGLFLIAAPFWGMEDDWQSKEYEFAEGFASKLPIQPSLFLYHSCNDPIVPSEHLTHYSDKLTDASYKILEGKDHYFKNGLTELVEDIKNL